MIDIDKISLSVEKYKSIYHKTARFADIDSFGVVHNIKYLYWIEAAREIYLQNIYKTLGMELDFRNAALMVVHSEIDYFIPARYNDELSILTRVSFIGSSSLIMDNIIKTENVILNKSHSVLVNINPRTMASEPIKTDIINAINEFEAPDYPQRSDSK